MFSEKMPEITMDANNLYREEVFTDQKVGSIRILTPVLETGEKDAARKIEYYGQTQVLTPAGALPLNFEIEADNLKDAIGKFAEGAKEAMEKTMEEIKEYRRQQASSIVMPGDPSLSNSKIQLP